MDISSETDLSIQNDWLAGSGEMGRLALSIDWSRTALGRRESWPQSLCTAVSLCLASPIPSAIAWGPQRIHIYNDPYSRLSGPSRRLLMGRDLRECWSSTWPAVNQACELAGTGQALLLEGQCIVVERAGRLEKTFFTASLSPIREESGGIGGLLIQLGEIRRSTIEPGETRGPATTSTQGDMMGHEMRIRQLVESNIVGAFSGALEGSVMNANEEFLRIVGYTREELLAGRINWKEITPPEFREETARAEQELHRTGICTPYRKEYKRKDGSRVPVFVWSALLEGGPETGIAFVLDLSERERTQEALRRSEEQWRDVFENNPTMYFMIDASGTVISVNSVGAEQLGYTVDELVGHSVLEVFPEVERSEARRHVALCLEHPGQSMSWEIRKMRKDGSMLWVRETAKAVVREKNQLVVLIVCEDITERMETQEKLRRSEAFLAEAQKISHTGSWCWNIPSGMLLWSEEHSLLFGIDPKAGMQPTFKLFLQLVHADDRSRIQHILEKAIRERTGFDCEYRITLFDGQVKHVQGVGKPIVKESGAIDDYIGTTMDITARKQAEEALRAAHDVLEKRVLERTCELKESNQRLELEIVERKRTEAVLARRSQELARSNAELEQLAYIASHDLQEPLRMVASYLQLIERRYQDKLDADGHEFIGYAVNGAHRMQALIDDLLTYSRIGTRGKPMQPTDCAKVVETALQSLRIVIAETDARITCAELPTVTGDEIQLTQLFQNLIANAIKFRRNCRPEIHILAQSDDGFWRISVQDNGIGIDPEYFSRIFDMFQRLHGSSAYPGNGIGLAICRKIVERHGGRIWVESVPGTGSAFVFTLPHNAGDAS